MLLVVMNWKSAAFADQSEYFEPETSSGLSELRERKVPKPRPVLVLVVLVVVVVYIVVVVVVVVLSSPCSCCRRPPQANEMLSRAPSHSVCVRP